MTQEKQPYERRIASLFGMDEATWQRHANPWSVWTRFSALPLIAIAIWSRDWIGGWAWIPTILSIFWIWLNPRVFSRPLSTDNWASKAVFGERVWLNRNVQAVPRNHRKMPHILNGIGMTGLPLIVWGLWTLEIWPLLLGSSLVYAGKVWFLDRMVWLYEDMKGNSAEYSGWVYHEKNGA